MAEQGWGDSIAETYKALAALTPLITAAIGGGGGGGPQGPSGLQRLIAQTMVHPHSSAQVSMADLLSPNFLGIRPPKPYGGKALPMGLAAGAIAPAALKGLGNLADILMPRGGQQGQQAGPPPPVVSGANIPQVDLGGGVTMDQYPMEMPVNVSPYDALGSELDPSLWETAY